MKFKLPAIFQKKPRARIPDTRPLARTGDARYVPQIATWKAGKDGKVACLANRYDEVSIRDYDRVRFYPVVRDALAVLRTPLKRANFHFVCSRQDVADLAKQELGPHIPDLVNILTKGALEFGYQVVEKVWVPKFEVAVTTTQADSSSEVERDFPFIWTIKRFASLSPIDSRLLVCPETSEFAGVRQFVGSAKEQNIPASKCIHYANDKEFDGNYGVPRTKAAVPFVELVESVFDDMGLYSKRFAVPWTVGRHKPGFHASGFDTQGKPIQQKCSDLMNDTLAGLESGHSVSLPAEYDANGNPLWGIEITQPPGEDRYVEKINLLNDMIRIALVVPEMASSQSPDTGTYNLGEAVLDLFIENCEAFLDELKKVIDEQLVKDFVLFNFGADAPECKIVFEPLDAKVKRALLRALLSLLSSGVPIEDKDGNTLEPDWSGVAQDNGLSLVTISAAQRLKKAMQGAIESRLAMPPAKEPGTDAAGPDPLQDDKAELSVKLSDENRTPDGRFAPKGTGDQTGGTNDGGKSNDTSDDSSVSSEQPIEKHPEFDIQHVVEGVKPTGYGVAGPQYAQFSGRPKEAIEHLKKAQTGEVPAGLSNSDIGEIDLVWGNEKHGLCKILTKHPEVVNDLPAIVEGLKLDNARSSAESHILTDGTYTAVVKRNWGPSKEKKRWLLTAFGPSGEK